MTIVLPRSLLCLLLGAAASAAVSAVDPSRSSSQSSQHLRIPTNNDKNAPQNKKRRQLQTTPTTTSTTVSPYWDAAEDYQANYVHFNDTMKEYLNEEFQELMRGSPDVNVFTTFPEPEQRIWPLVKGMTIRNHLDPKILWARPNYLITDGLTTGCREQQGEITVPVASALCDDHCTHGGRYCHPEPPANLPPTVTGKSLVLEVLRRLCIDGYYHASDYKFFRYLENFERAGCLVASDMTVCSLEVMDKISFLDYANLETCVGDLNEIRADVPNPKLDEQIEAAQKHQIDSVTDIPSLYLGGVKYTGELSTEAIFREYCAVFERAGKMHPVSCDICKDCQNVRKCLWTLECDGVAFEETTFLAWHNQSAPAIVEPTSPSPAPAEGGQPIDIPVATLPPGGIAAPANSASTVDTTAVKTKNSSSSGGGANNQAVLVFFLIALCASALVAGLIVLRDRAHSKRMADVAASQAHAEGTYHDNAIGGNDYHDYDPDDSNSNLEHDDNGGYRDNSLELSPTRGGPPKGAFM